MSDAEERTVHDLSNRVVTLTVAFVILRLANEIDWKWVWVLSPLWIGLALAIFYGILSGISEPTDE